MPGPHQAVHRHALEALAQFSDGDITLALSELGSMEEASMKVLACLEQMALAAEHDNSLLCQTG